MNIKDGTRKAMIASMLQINDPKEVELESNPSKLIAEQDEMPKSRGISERNSQLEESGSELGEDELEMREMTALGKLTEFDADTIRKKIEKERLKKGGGGDLSPHSKDNPTIEGPSKPSNFSELSGSKSPGRLPKLQPGPGPSHKVEESSFIVSDDEGTLDNDVICMHNKESIDAVKPSTDLDALKHDDDFKYIGDVKIDLIDKSVDKNDKKMDVSKAKARRSSVIRRRSVEMKNDGGNVVKNEGEVKEGEIGKESEKVGWFDRLIARCQRKKKGAQLKKKKESKKSEKSKNDYAEKLKQEILDIEENNMEYYKSKDYQHLQLDTKYSYNKIPNPAFSSIREVIPHIFHSKKNESAEQQIQDQENITLPMKYSSQGVAQAQKRELMRKGAAQGGKESRALNQKIQATSSMIKSTDRTSSDSEIDGFEETEYRTDFYEQRKGSKVKQERHDFFKELETAIVKKPFPISFSVNKRLILKAMSPGPNEESYTNSVSAVRNKRRDKGTVAVDFNADEAVVTEMFLRDHQEVEKAFKELHHEEEHHDYNMLYVCIRANDSGSKLIEKYNWSGNQIMSTGSFTVSQTQKVISALNKQKLDIWKRGCSGFIYTCRRYCREFVDTSLINGFLMVCVFLNTLMLAMDGLAPDSWADLFFNLNLAFTTVFTVEMTIKLFGLGIKNYCKDTFNIFDSIIVALSLVELVISLTSSENGGGATSAFRAVRIFRIMRVLRVTRLLRSLRFMKVIIEVIRGTFEQFVYIALLMFLFVFIFTLLGTQIFGGQFKFDVYDYDPTRYNFDSFTSAFFTVFTILTLENWNDVLYSCLRSDANSLLAVVYLISWIFIGNYIFINLFLSILLEGFESSESLQQIEEIDNERRDLARVHKQLIHAKAEREKKQRDELTEAYREVELITQPEKFQEEEIVKSSQACYLVVRNNEEDNESLSDACDIKKQLASTNNSAKVKIDPYTGVTCYKSLFYFKKAHPLRLFCAKIVSHPK